MGKMNETIICCIATAWIVLSANLAPSFGTWIRWTGWTLAIVVLAGCVSAVMDAQKAKEPPKIAPKAKEPPPKQEKKTQADSEEGQVAVRAMITEMGFSRSEAVKAVNAVPPEYETAAEIIYQALRNKK